MLVYVRTFWMIVVINFFKHFILNDIIDGIQQVTVTCFTASNQHI